MEREAFINNEDKIVNSCEFSKDDMVRYLEACEFHNLQIDTRFFRKNLCDISISENSLLHYAQKARFSLCFSFCLESVHNSNNLCVLEFFLQSNCREYASENSYMHLLMRIMEMELKNFVFASGSHHQEVFDVQLRQPKSIGGNSTVLMVMKSYWESYSEKNFTKYLQTVDLCCLKPEGRGGWVFCSPERQQISENDTDSEALLVPLPVMEKIKYFMKKIATNMLMHYGIVQFWAPKMVRDRCYLETSNQPYALGWLAKGLASFRKSCLKHHYFVDATAKEDELGHPRGVFRNMHPEITPDLRLYSTSEFSIRKHVAHCTSEYVAWRQVCWCARVRWI